MNRVFEFVFILRRCEEEKQKLYKMMEYEHHEKYEIEGWSLSFDYEHKIIQVHDNGKDPRLKYKFTPAEITYDSLVALVEKDLEYDLDITYLE